MSPRWNSRAVEWLRIHADVLTDEECAHAIGKTKKAIKLKRQRLGIGKPMGRPAGNNGKIYTKISECKVVI